jgi:hypothetical protein
MDLIDRQAAIDAVCMEWCGVKHQDCKHPLDVEKDDYFWCDGCETALRTLPDLLSAQPRMRGKWKTGINENGVTTSLFCSECNYENKHWYEWNYCPHCGADMRGNAE